MKNKKWIGIIVAVVCVVLIVVGIMAVKSSRKSETERKSAVDDSAENSDGAIEGEEIPFEVMDGSDAVLEDDTEGSGADGSGVAGDLPDGSAWRNSQGSGGTGAGENGTDGTQGSTISFPYAIPNTNLTIQSMASYDGIFLEDGSDVEVSGIASIIVKNEGATNVEYANIVINSEGAQLTFRASDIAAGASVVVQEANQTAYTETTYTSCSADVAELAEFEMSADKVKVEENEDGSLTITNLTAAEIPCVRVFYKFYMDEENAYVGGITYTAKLTNLEANGSQKVTPSHYSAGYSKVVMIRTYDTAE